MRTLNLRFAAGLLFALTLIGVGTFFLHRFQYDRISRDLLWQVERARDGGETNEAITHAYRYLEFRPDDAKMLIELAGWLEQRPGNRKQYASVVNLLERALRAEPDRADVRRRVVALDLRLGQWGECIDHLERLLLDAPDDAELLTWFGEAKQATGHHAEAATAFEKAIQANPKRIEGYLAYAHLLGRHLRRPDDARRMLDSAVKVNPANANARIARARFFRGAGMFAEAETDAKEAVRLAPENSAILVAAGEVFQAAGKIRPAREYVQKACDLEPKNGRSICTLAWLLLYDGKAAEAAERLQAVVRDNPGDIDALTLLGDILALDGRLDALEKIVVELEKARRTNPARSWNADYLQARLLMRRGDWRQAATQLDQLRLASAKAPGLAKQANYLMAQCFEQLRDRPAELDAYRRVIEIDANAGYFRLEYARALGRAGNFDEAAKQFRAAVQRPDLQPRAVTDGALELIERCLRGGAERVVKDLERAFAPIRGDDPNVNAVLAKVEVMRLRRHDADALRLADAYLAKHPGHVAMHVARARLLEGLFGPDRAFAALAAAEKKLGDQADFRVARLRLLAPRVEIDQTAKLFDAAAGLDKFAPDDRTRVLSELIAACGTAGDVVRMGRALELLRNARPDHLGVREILLTRALAAANDVEIAKLLGEVAAIEGRNGWTTRRFAAERLVRVGGKFDQGRAALGELWKTRPEDPIVEFLLGRLDELEEKPTALAHYKTALDRGLLDLPIEEQFWSLGGDTSGRKVRILLEVSPLIERLRLDQDRTVMRSILPLIPPSGRAAIADRLLRANPEATAPQLVWLGKTFQQLGLNRYAESAFARAANLAPQSDEVWAARLIHFARRQERAKITEMLEEARKTLPPAQAAAFLARSLEAAGLNADAMQEARKAIEVQPNDVRTRRQLVNLYVQSGHTPEARKQLMALIERADTLPDDQAWARRTLAINLTMSPSLASFRSSLQLLNANKSPQGFLVEDLRAQALVFATQKNRPLEEGMTARQKAIQILEDLEKRSTNCVADDLVLLARLYQAEDNAAGYQRACARLERECTESYQAIAYLARQALQSDNPAAADPCLATLERIDPRRFETLALRFQRQARAGAVQAALSNCEQYIAAAPEGPNRSARMLRCGHMIFDFLQNCPLADQLETATALREAAIKLYRPAFGRDPKALLQLVTLYGRHGQTGQGLDLLQTPEVRSGFSIEAQAAAAVVAIRTGTPTTQQRTAVEKQVGEWAAKNPGSVALILSQADLLDHVQKHDQAVELYRTVLSRDPANLLALNNLAWILSYDPAKIGESQRLIQEAIDQNGLLDDLLDTRARILFKANRRDEGLRDLAEAIRESPSASRYFNLAVMQHQAGRADLAERALARARQFGLSPADVHPLDAVAYRELVRN